MSRASSDGRPPARRPVLTDLQRRTAQAIVQVLETGTPTGGYDRVTVLAGDTGQLSYGKLQATLASGSLYLLLVRYCASADTIHAARLRPYLPALKRRDSRLNHDARLHVLLRRAGADPAMRRTQDELFDDLYWQPALLAATPRRIGSPLGITVVFDSLIHGAWRLVSRHTDANTPASGRGERRWIRRYLRTRRDWLAGHANPLLHRTVYRIDALEALVNAGLWDLALPVTVRGQLIDALVLDGNRAAHADGEAGERLLMLQRPLLAGEDVRAVQRALNVRGERLLEDGRYGRLTAAAVRRFQSAAGLRVDGMVGPATRAALGVG